MIFKGRAIVGIKYPDGTIKVSNVGSDEHEITGKNLYKYYLNQDRVERLLSLGGIEEVNPSLNKQMSKHIERLVWKNPKTRQNEVDNTNIYFNSEQELFDRYYNHFFITIFPRCFIFDVARNEWMVNAIEARKLIPYSQTILGEVKLTLQEIIELRDFLYDKVSPIGQRTYESHNRDMPNNYMTEFSYDDYQYLLKIYDLEQTAKATKKNGGVYKPYKRNEKDVKDILEGQDPKPELLDCVLDMMENMSPETIKEILPIISVYKDVDTSKRFGR